MSQEITKLEVQDMKVLGSITIALSDQLTVLYGKNGKGKSTIADIIRIMGTNEKPSKESARAWISYGKSSGVAKLSHKGGEKVWSVPDNAFTLTGPDTFKASRGATGLESFLDMKEADKRFDALSSILKTEISFDDFKAEFEDCGITETALENIWNTNILNATSKKPDFRAANENFINQRKEQKRDWCKATGNKNYGGADSWLPVGYERDLAGENEESLRGQLSAFETSRDAALQNEAVDSHKRDKIEADAEKLPKAIEDLEKSKAKKDEIYILINDLTEELKFTGSEFKCACGKDYLIRDNQAHEWNREEGIADMSAAELTKKIAAANNDLQNAIALVTREQAWIDTTEKLIAELPAKGDIAKVEQARAKVEQARVRLDAFVANRDAQKLYKEIEQTEKLVAVTASDGLPGKKLAAAIVKLNKVLADLCQAAGWKAVKIANNTGVTYGNENYIALSGGLQFRVKATIQFAFAMADESEIVVIDPTDTLDPDGKTGVLDLIDFTGIPALITCIAKDKQDCLEPEDGDYIYWLDDTGVTSLSPVPF